jgi:hypothetical protein
MSIVSFFFFFSSPADFSRPERLHFVLLRRTLDRPCGPLIKRKTIL